MVFLDFILLIMIGVCVFYCWILNRRIQDLQNSRIEFARMIKELNASIVKAANNVNEMSELSKVTSTAIKAVVEEAKEATVELLTISEVANDLSAKLHNQTKSIRSKKANSSDSKSSSESYKNSITSKSGERFTVDDLALPTDDKDNKTYTAHLKNFIQNIATKKSDNSNAKLDQIGYYETLRKINAKK